MVTKVIQMMEKTVDGYDKLIPTGAGIVIRIFSLEGTTVTCSFNGQGESYTFTTTGTHDFYGAVYGEYTITATDGVDTNTITKEIKDSKLYEMTAFAHPLTLNECTWSQISKISLMGDG